MGWMNMKRSLGSFMITTLLGIGSCAVAYRIARTADESPDGEGRTSSTRHPLGGTASPALAELAELRRELAQLRLQVRGQGLTPAAADAARAAEDHPGATRDPRTDPEARAELERERREYMAGVDAAFRSEATSPGWSSAISAVIQTAMADNSGLRPIGRGVECRSTTCRVEIADDGSVKLGKALPLLIHQVGQELPSVVANRVEDGRGGATMVLYMSRQDMSRR